MLEKLVQGELENGKERLPVSFPLVAWFDSLISLNSDACLIYFLRAEKRSVTSRQLAISTLARVFRAKCDSASALPVARQHGSPGGAPQVGHRTSCALSFIRTMLGYHLIRQ